MAAADPKRPPVPRSDRWHPAHWTMAELRYELAYQLSDGIHTTGPGHCGHNARGSGYCADCLRAEIARREGAPC